MALTDLEVAIIEQRGKRAGKRVLIRPCCPRVRQFFRENYRYVISSETGDRIPVCGSEKGKPYASNLLEKVAIEVLRAVDEMNGNRTRDSLASWAQLERLRQFEEILKKRVDNKFVLPPEYWRLTIGEAGRLHGDMEEVLVGEGMWDRKQKVEMVKTKKSWR